VYFALGTRGKTTYTLIQKKGIFIITSHPTEHRISDRVAQSTELDVLKKDRLAPFFPE